MAIKLNRDTAGCVWNGTDDSFTKRCMDGKLRRFVWGPTRSTPGGVGGLMVWDLQEVAVKPFTNFSIEILIVFNFQKAALKPFTHFQMKY